ncbi:unnamed protein product, partial [Closterium sp. Naga37s-1]
SSRSSSSSSSVCTRGGHSATGTGLSASCAAPARASQPDYPSRADSDSRPRRLPMCAGGGAGIRSRHAGVQGARRAWSGCPLSYFHHRPFLFISCNAKRSGQCCISPRYLPSRRLACCCCASPSK